MEKEILLVPRVCILHLCGIGDIVDNICRASVQRGVKKSRHHTIEQKFESSDYVIDPFYPRMVYTCVSTRQPYPRSPF